jgi:7,8-dihydropterin-6-yl-methyl-4-(beta-D-ribofuranosyl)aminobenzene 5'-phosphate synthase
MTALRLRTLSSVSITLICENTARGAGILGEHGLCWWIESEDHHLIFDLGQGLSLSANATKLGINLLDTDAIVFSHGHYDHIGGWASLPAAVKNKPVFLHPDALLPKFQRRADGRVDPAGKPSVVDALPRESSTLIAQSSPTEVIPGIWMTGQIPRSNTYEDTGGDFVQDPAGKQPDPLNDDQSLFFKTEAGIVVVLGCTHSGLINTLTYIQDLTQARIHAVFGGMHLLHAKPERMTVTIEALKTIAPDWLGPNHCTGDAAVAEIRTAFPDQCFECHAGQTFIFPKTTTTHANTTI